MLKTPSEFPHPGSYALFEGEKVRIIRATPAGNCFISARNISRTVPVDHLKPFDEDRPAVHIWADRIVAVGGGVLTPAGQVYADYCDWYARKLPRDAQLARPGFDRAMLAMGFRQVRARVGDRMSRCWALALTDAQRRAA